MFRRLPHLIAFAIFIALAGANPLMAQEEAAIEAGSPPLTVGVYLNPPFVMLDEGRYSGMAVELWEWLAEQRGLQSSYVEFKNIGELVNATAAGEVDVVLTNLSVTRARAERIDFTHPWFDAGQRIMINEDQGGGAAAVLAGLSETGHLQAYGWIVFVIIMATVVVTMFDRRFDENFPQRWRDGLAEGFYTVMSVATSGRSPARKNLFGWLGRIWQGLWLVCGIAVLAYVTSSVTSVMTTLALTNHITSVADLPGRVVGVQPGSVSEEYARQAELNIRSFEQVEDAVQALLDGRIDAIIDDAPVLEYYAHNNPHEPLNVVGPIFAPDKYAFGLNLESPLTRPLTIEVIGAIESGFLATIRERHFGDDP